MALPGGSDSPAETRIDEQLQNQRVRVIANVKQLFLADGNFESIPDLRRFRYLTHLFAGGNKLRRVDFLFHNFYLSHLYLNDNSLSSLIDAIEHLTVLKVLHLHNNELENLNRVLWAFRRMQMLESLTLFGNQCAQESDYLARVITAVPSVKELDRHLIQPYERKKALRALDSAWRGSGAQESATGRTSEQREVTADFGNHLYKQTMTFGSLEEAAAARQQRRTLSKFSTFDWLSVPTEIERRANYQRDFAKPKAITYDMKL